MTDRPRHAVARHGHSTVTTTPAYVRLTIEDDGRGFDRERGLLKPRGHDAP